MTETIDNVYLNTAYNSQVPRRLDPVPPSKNQDGHFTQVALGAPLNLPGKAHCQEYAGEWRCDIRDLIELKKPGSDDKKSKKLGNPHLVDRWPSLFEWAIFSRMLCYGAAWFAFAGGGFTSIYIFFAVGYKEALDLFTWGFLPLLSIWLILKLLTRGEPKLKKDTRFYRRTGIVSIYQKRKARLEIPFDEFDPHMTTRTAATGSTGFMLLLVHRYSDLVISHINDYPEVYQVYLEWEALVQFMDVSQPLPDQPIIEPARQFDPVTALYDKKTSRPKHFWRGMCEEEFAAHREAARQAAKEFPWGKTREQALASGWKPSEQRIDWKAFKEKHQTA